MCYLADLATTRIYTHTRLIVTVAVLRTVCETFSRTEVKNRHFRPLILRYSPYRPVAEERNLYIIEKYV